MSPNPTDPALSGGRANGGPLRVLMYVQHLSGIGHQHRSARISRALIARGLQVTYVSGGMPIPGLDPGVCDRVQLAPVRAADQRYQKLLDASGRAVTESWKATRREHLLQVLEDSRADAVLVETYPFGRKLMRFELEPFVQSVAAWQPRKLLLCSVRDILEPGSGMRRYKPMADQVERYFDRVLVHSDPALFNFADTFPLYERIRDKVLYTGYISETGAGRESRSARAADPRYTGAVIVSAGGGATGGDLLRTALEARPLSQLHDRHWLLLAGPHLPRSAYDALRAGAGENVEVQRNQSNFRAILAACRVSVSQAGYNTMLDLLSTGTRTVLVPFARFNEREQIVRARHLAALGLATVVDARDLNARSLAAAIDAAAAQASVPSFSLDVAGAQYSARLIQALLTGAGIPPRDNSAGL